MLTANVDPLVISVPTTGARGEDYPGTLDTMVHLWRDGCMPLHALQPMLMDFCVQGAHDPTGPAYSPSERRRCRSGLACGGHCRAGRYSFASRRQCALWYGVRSVVASNDFAL